MFLTSSELKEILDLINCPEATIMYSSNRREETAVFAPKRVLFYPSMEEWDGKPVIYINNMGSHYYQHIKDKPTIMVYKDFSTGKYVKSELQTS